MPIGIAMTNNLKVNNMMGPSTITAPDGANAGYHYRDMSLDDDRGNRR